MIRSEFLGLAKHTYLIQTIILIYVLWLPGISKICFSFADKYTCAQAHPTLAARDAIDYVKSHFPSFQNFNSSLHSLISNVFINIHEYESWTICILDNE